MNRLSLASLTLPALALLPFLIIGSSGSEATLPSQLPHTNLLVYLTKRGVIAPVETTKNWKQRRLEILEAMQVVMGPLPGKQRRCALDVQVEREIDEGAFVRRFLTYTSEPGSRVPAWLLFPHETLASRNEFPAILALHPTDFEYGHRVVVGALRPQYPPYARDLAQRGFVVLAPAYPLMAGYHPDLKALGYQSGTMKAVWDNIRGLDLLESLPFVKKSGFGAMGHSLGGHNAIFTAVFDPRLQVVVSSCGFDSFHNYMDGNIDGWTSERYMPRLAQFYSNVGDIPFDFYELIGALAPRPVLISAPLHDSNFKSGSVDRIVDAALPIYRLYAAGGNLRLIHPECGHEFPAEIREEAYRFLEAQLR
jgi:hypothetical protein